MLEFQVSVVSGKSVSEAVAAVGEALAARKFSVLWQLNVNETLAGKGFSLEPEVRILEVCSAPRAKEALETNIEVAGFLPCKIVVKQVNGQTTIGLIKPTMLMSVLGDQRLEHLAQEVEAVLLEAVEAAR